MVERKQTNDHWSRYWAYGSLTSLPQDFRKNYDGELAIFWQQIINSLDESVSVIDVCTGNLALPLLMKQLNEKLNKSMQITGVDLAKIDKQAIASQHPETADWLKDIKVLDSTAIEDLAVVIEQPVDLITSQYGIEYCDIESIAPQILPLLKPGGRLVFVSHAADTAILSAMKEEQMAFDLLNDWRVFETMKSFGEGRYKPAYFQKQVLKQLSILHEHILQTPVQLLQIFHQALGGLSQLSITQLSTQREAVAQFYMQHWQAQLRAADLLTVSEKIAKNPEWYLPFENAGLVLEHKQSILYQGKHNAGTAYQFRKSDKK